MYDNDAVARMDNGERCSAMNYISIRSHFVAQTPAGAAPAGSHDPRWRGVAAAAGTTGKFQQ